MVQKDKHLIFLTFYYRFEQCEEVINDKYSVNIPMRYYWKGKFRKGYINITNSFRGTWVERQALVKPFLS